MRQALVPDRTLLDQIDRDTLSPMMKQYVEQKDKRPECLIFFRMGDFYELFLDDAKIAAKELEITLTARDAGQKERVPMAGVPHHSADRYLNRLVEKGYRVAVCEQVEDPAQAKGLVKRDVVRVVTPGTVTDTSVLLDNENNYLVSVFAVQNYFGIASCDVTTGDFQATQIITGAVEGKLRDEIMKLAPAEILCNQDFLHLSNTSKLDQEKAFTYTVLPDEAFVEDADAPYWTDEAIPGSLSMQAAASLAYYIAETQQQIPVHLKPCRFYEIETHMQLGETARRNLELVQTIRDQQRRGSLIWVLDRCVTSMGSRLLKRWLDRPLLNLRDIHARQDAIEVLLNDYMTRTNLREALGDIYDIERLAGKLGLGSINARELSSLTQALSKIPELLKLLSPVSEQSELLQRISTEIHPEDELTRQLQDGLSDDLPISLTEGGLIKKGYHPEVDELREAAEEGTQYIYSLEATERETTGIKNLKIGYNRVFGYYIEVSKGNIGLVPDHYIRKQTLTNAERYVTPDLKEREERIMGAKQKLLTMEYELFCDLRDKAAARTQSMLSSAAAIATLDVLQALADVANREDYVKPEVTLGTEIILEEARHPVVEKMLPSGAYVPNDTALDQRTDRVFLITGPNMSGKSTYMRQVALCVILAQLGAFVPAKRAVIGLVDRVFTRIGSSDDVGGGQSTFMVEMNEIAEIMNEASDRSLLILDEIGRGTSTFDGLAIAWAIIEQVANPGVLGARTLFATHYHELTELEGAVTGIINYHVTVERDDKEVHFLHRIERGPSDESYGIEVGRLAGLPDEVINRAYVILQQLEKDNAGQLKYRLKRPDHIMEGQIDMFASQLALQRENDVLQHLRDLDIRQLTPLDALNLLAKLADEAKHNQLKTK